MIKTEVSVKHVDMIFNGTETTPFDLLGIKNTLRNRWKFRDEFYIFNYNIKEFLKLKADNIQYEPCNIAIPTSIDNISFQNMMSLQAFNSKGKTAGEVISEKIAIVCADVNDISINELEKIVYNMPFKSAMGIYNWITKSLETSRNSWEKRFVSVSVPDKDYDQAGGHRMNQFNVINTIKNTCNDFNVTYKEAWQMSYSVLQTNSYSRATSGHIQHEMEKIKHARMVAQQKRPQ